MKWPVLFSGVAIVVACGAFYRFSLPAEKQAEQQPASQLEPVGRRLPISSAAASTAVTTNPVPAAPSAPVTNHRRRIYDSPDIMATINEVRHHGTADERDWAVYLLYSCALLFQPVPPPLANGEGADTSKSASKAIDPALEAKKSRAFQVLSERCRGVKGLTHDDRESLRRELKEPATGYRSVLRDLDFLSTEVRDGRWSEDQARLITNSLYSGDPIVARDAFRAMLATMDENAPGGKDREDAFMLGVGGIYDAGPISEYDRLQACYTAGWCSSRGAPADAFPAPSAGVLQLASKYIAAVNAHMDARSILAIR